MTVKVYLDGKQVGEIKEVEGGFAYHPEGGKPGKTFSTVGGVRWSIERG